MNNEPVAWMSQGGDVSRSKRYFEDLGFTDLIPLHPVKELTDEEIHQAIRRGFSREGFLSDGIFLEIKELLRKESEK